MANIRGTMAMSVAAIRAYLLTGDDKFKDEFKQLWARNDAAFAELNGRKKSLTPGQLAVWEKLNQARKQFTPLPGKCSRSEARINGIWDCIFCVPRPCRMPRS